MISLKDVTVSKRGVKLFEGFNLHLREGEHWLIQGENGSGKTALLQLIAGIVHPHSGQVSYDFISGNDWDTLYKQRQEKIHFVPAQWLHAFLSGFDGLFYQQRYYTMDDTELPKVRDVFGDDLSALRTFTFSDNFDIRALLDLPLTRLSNGQLKKVIVLRQLVKNIPKILIMDYPFDGLDARSRADLSQFINDLATQFRIQVMLVDHGDTFPSVMNRKLILREFKIDRIEDLVVKKTSESSYNKPTAGVHKDTGPVVEMQDLTIQYGDKKILSNVNWRINKGERWALTGKNGSGKTTLFSLIYADHPMAYSQKVFLFGKRRGTGESIWDIKKRINYFGPEQIHFLNAGSIGITARQHIISQKHRRAERLPELIEFFDAGKYIDKPVRFLSSGELQMALLMNMFLDDKELLLLDEPFQFLDPENHEKVTKYLNQHLDEDVTLVMITHDERDVSQWTQLRKTL